jgi:hypothetical protein
MKSLDQIFCQRITDKGSLGGLGHNYAAVYETLFEPLRASRIKLLEIGIWDGASLESWHEYFVNAQIYGAEIAPRHDENQFVDRPRIETFIGDATDPELIPDSDFQIIIDDADHALKTQLRLLAGLWPKLNPGGYYIIEDLFVGDLPWGGSASTPKSDVDLNYNGYSAGDDLEFLPRQPQDLNFLNRAQLPDEICNILNHNKHFFTITSVSPRGGLHMMLVLVKNQDR